MRDVLIDNWSLENIAFDLNDRTKLLNNPAFHNILEAMVLWDNVYYPKNDYSFFWKYLSYESGLDRYLKGCEENDLYLDEAKCLYKEFCDEKKYTENIACGAIRYSMVANKFGYDYLPCPIRGNFIQQTGIYKKIYNINQIPINGGNSTPLSRKELWDPINKDIKDYYQDLNERCKSIHFDVNLPVLANYIIQSKPKNMNYLEYASQLKKKPSVKLYINYLNDIEKKIAEGNTVALSQFNRDMKDIVDEVCNEDKKLIIQILTSIIPSPVFQFNIFDLRKINFTFVRQVVRYEVKNK
jgi:hypothetical protein